MTVRELQQRKKALGYTNEMIAEKSGIPLGTVQKIFAGVTDAPRRKTMEALERVLGAETGVPAAIRYADYIPLPSDMMIREDALAYAADPKQGSYTLEDYYALPDDCRVELIDGVFYDLASPQRIHQAILGRLHYELVPCVDAHPECELFMAPSDVRLDNDDRTMVQPDLYIVCGRTDMDPRRLNGAPDFACEILSPSSRSHDLLLKLYKYRNAGVREYWVVDPDRLQVIVFDLEHDLPKKVYSFHDKVPVGISGGECTIDFERIFEKIKRYI